MTGPRIPRRTPSLISATSASVSSRRGSFTMGASWEGGRLRGGRDGMGRAQRMIAKSDYPYVGAGGGGVVIKRSLTNQQTGDDREDNHAERSRSAADLSSPTSTSTVAECSVLLR